MEWGGWHGFQSHSSCPVPSCQFPLLPSAYPSFFWSFLQHLLVWMVPLLYVLRALCAWRWHKMAPIFSNTICRADDMGFLKAVLIAIYGSKKMPISRILADCGYKYLWPRTCRGMEYCCLGNSPFALIGWAVPLEENKINLSFWLLWLHKYELPIAYKIRPNEIATEFQLLLLFDWHASVENSWRQK